MVSTQDIQHLLDQGGGTVVGPEGDKLGKVGQVYLDDQSGAPEWVTVSTGLFGGSESFVPLADARIEGTEITVPFDKATVKDAPRVDGDGDGHISPEQESELYRYYQMTEPAGQTQQEGVYDQMAADTTGGRGDRDGDGLYDDVDPATAGRDTSGVTTDDAMTRSEEQLEVGTQKVATGKARLRKYITTEQQTVTVPVRREEVVLEREPITAENADRAMDGPELSEEEHEMTLHEEQVVVDKNVVPVERVKMARKVVTEDQQVTEDVRSEQIEQVEQVVEGDDERTTR